MNWNRSQPTRMLYATADNAKNLFFPFPVTFRIQVFSFCNLTSLTLSVLFVFLSIFFFFYFSADLIFHITCFFLLHLLISSSLIKLLSQSFCTTLRNINLILIFLLGKLKGCWDSKRKLEAILYLLLFYLVASCHVLHLVIGW